MPLPGSVDWGNLPHVVSVHGVGIKRLILDVKSGSSSQKEAERSPRKNILNGIRIDAVDGLRAIAILTVVGFHAGWSGFSQGYVGVDIFFVISGFLIITQIVERLSSGTFSIWEFYAQRTLRILPPFLLVLVVSTVIAQFILVSPKEFEWFTLSSVLSGVFLSNFYFLSKQDYFDISMFEKVLLHTWSLSIEEQFYLFAPLLIMLVFVFAAWRRKPPMRVLTLTAVATFVLSLVGCILFTSDAGKNFGFYVTPLRAWEFVAGGSIGFLVSSVSGRIPSQIWNLLALLGGVMIVIATSMDLSHGYYPGIAAVVPVLAATMLIASAIALPTGIFVRYLSLAPIRAIGLVSYSWYLWHWPLLTFARLAEFGEYGFWRDQAMILLSLFLAIVTYFGVERPINRFRRTGVVRPISKRIFAAGVGACLVVSASAGAVGGASYLAAKENPLLSGNSTFLSKPDLLCANEICISTKTAGVGLLTGDSHTWRLHDIFARINAESGVQFLPPAEMEADSQSDIDYVVTVRKWQPYFADPDKTAETESMLSDLSAGGSRRLLIIGPLPVFDDRGTECILRAERYGLDLDRCSLPRSRVDADRAAAVEALRRLALQTEGARYVDPIDLFCDNTLCRPYKDGTILYRDTNHLNDFGAAYLYNSLKRHFIWAITGQEG